MGRDVTILKEGLKAWREERQLSQHELAIRADCSATLIAMIETGERQPRIGNAQKIAKALGVPLTAFALVHVDGLKGEAAA